MRVMAKTTSFFVLDSRKAIDRTCLRLYISSTSTYCMYTRNIENKDPS